MLSFYENMQDEQYEVGREQRGIQARKLLELAQPYCPSGRLLDIGAGSGILVEQALALEYKAEGVEPSRWLWERAISYGLKVHLGAYPHPDVCDDIDMVTLVDVIEHVPNPVDLLVRVRNQMSDRGVGLIVTPDLSSLAARLMGWRWWHFRVAHIGYFNKSTLLLALKRAELEPIRIGRPGWYFPADYLLERINEYLPSYLHLPIFRMLGRITIPLNLRDSLFVVFRKNIEIKLKSEKIYKNRKNRPLV